MMGNSLKIVCPHCDASNRVVADRLSDEPVCGRCKKPLFNGQPVELTSSNFDRHINNSDLPVLVDFWAPWCGPCKTMAPVIAAAANMLGTSVRVTKLNTEAVGDIAARYGIRSIPTLMIFHHGKIVQQRAGATDIGSLINWVKSSLTAAG